MKLTFVKALNFDKGLAYFNCWQSNEKLLPKSHVFSMKIGIIYFATN